MYRITGSTPRVPGGSVPPPAPRGGAGPSRGGSVRRAMALATREPQRAWRRLSTVKNALLSAAGPFTTAAATHSIGIDALMDADRHPTQAGIDLFWEQGYLVLPDFLSEWHVARLNAAFESLVDRRRDFHARGVDPLGHEHGWANGDQFPPTGQQGPTRVFCLLHEPAPDGSPIFLDLLDHAPSLAWVRALLNTEPHVHSTDGYLDSVRGFPSEAWDGYGAGWHIDGILSGFRELGGPNTKNTNTEAPIPLMQLKLAYYLSDLSKPDQGNLTVIPKSHVAPTEPPAESLTVDASSEGRAVQVCGTPGTCILFHNAIFHTAGPMRAKDGHRSLLYYGYEHPCASTALSQCCTFALI